MTKKTATKAKNAKTGASAKKTAKPQVKNVKAVAGIDTKTKANTRGGVRSSAKVSAKSSAKIGVKSSVKVSSPKAGNSKIRSGVKTDTKSMAKSGNAVTSAVKKTDEARKKVNSESRMADVRKVDAPIRVRKSSGLSRLALLAVAVIVVVLFSILATCIATDNNTVTRKSQDAETGSAAEEGAMNDGQGDAKADAVVEPAKTQETNIQETNTQKNEKPVKQPAAKPVVSTKPVEPVVEPEEPKETVSNETPEWGEGGEDAEDAESETNWFSD